MFRRALVSTSDKTGLVEFLKPFAEKGCEIVSTGGTSRHLREKGLRVTEVSEVTGFPEVMDGRVRTLHPRIHMGLLARSFVEEDMRLLKEQGVQPFDLVVVNLYPFEEAFNKGLKDADLIEEIDIGGPALLRASAKSFERVTVVCDPADYSEISRRAQEGRLDESFRRKQASKVFSHCSFYDSLVSQALSQEVENIFDDSLLNMTLGLRKKKSLRYGENPHQKAAFFESFFKNPLSLHNADQLQGKELSYNNILDLEAAVGVAADFEEPCCAIIKHLTPCGVALAGTIEAAFKKAFQADPISAFGGIIALNRTLDAELAKELISPFLECVIAPEVTSEAAKIVSAKKNLRVLTLRALNHFAMPAKLEFEFKSVRGGVLFQSSDRPPHWESTWRIIGSKPAKDQQEDMVFAQRIVRHVKSNAIVVAQNRQSLGICGGQTNRVDSVRWALERAQKVRPQKGSLVLGSDAFFPFRDSVDLAARAGVGWIIQPGGSLRDAEVEAAAREHGIGMVMTGTRHFKH